MSCNTVNLYALLENNGNEVQFYWISYMFIIFKEQSQLLAFLFRLAFKS